MRNFIFKRFHLLESKVSKGFCSGTEFKTTSHDLSVSIYVKYRIEIVKSNDAKVLASRSSITRSKTATVF